MKLVTDGEKWGIKRGFWIFSAYYDFSHGYWWGRGNKWLSDCYVDKETAERWLKRFTA